MESKYHQITAEEYSVSLCEIGEAFRQFFTKRCHTLPLHIQIACGMLTFGEIEQILHDKPHLVNVRDDFGRTPLMVHWKDGVYRLLLEHGANPNQCDDSGNTVLMYHRRNQEAVALLLSYGADLNARNQDGVSLLVMAQLEGLPIKPLLKAGAIWQSVGRQDINVAFLNCLNSEDVDVLAKIVSDVLPSEEAYHYARVWCGCHSQEKFDWLGSLKVKYTHPTESSFSQHEEKVFLDELALRKRDVESGGFMALLRNMRECLTETDSLNQYLTHDASVLLGVVNNEIMEEILNAGADPNLGVKWKDDTSAGTLLYSAVSARNAQAVKLLLDAGAEPTSGTSYMDLDDTCVACAIRNNDLDILQMLIEAKADLNFALRCNRTPVITAIQENNLPALKMLIEAGAKPNLPDPYDRVPSCWLDETRNSPELIAYFRAVIEK